MPISDIPILSMLRARMQWHQERQEVLAENVANADTPNYRPRDLAPPNFENALQTVSLPLTTTAPGHIGGAGGSGSAFAKATILITRFVRAATRSRMKTKCSSSPATRWTTTR